MYKRFRATVVLSFLGLGACHQAPTVEEVLTSNKGQFWDLRYAHAPRPLYAYRFYTNGTCFRYVIRNNNTTLYRFDGGDVEYSNEWRVSGDTLTIDDVIRVHVTGVTPDSIFLKTLKSQRPLMLVKAPTRLVAK